MLFRFLIMSLSSQLFGLWSCPCFAPYLPFSHPVFIEPVCAEGGTPKPGLGGPQDPPSMPFAYIQPELRLTAPEIASLRDTNLRSLIHRKKLHLVVDLDHTLLHSTWTRNLTPEQIHRLKATTAAVSFVEFFRDHMMVKLRPGAHEFLEKASVMFDLSIYTKGQRLYADAMAKLLDPDGSLFGGRVMSREDCLMGQQKTLDVVLEHERLVLIVDDSEKVWIDDHKGNLIKIPPYKFFTKSDTPHDNPETKFLYRLRDDEDDEKDEKLVRVLRTLEEVHRGFYGGGLELEKAHVRQVLEQVQMKRKREESVKIERMGSDIVHEA